MVCHLHMLFYFLGTFTEYPEKYRYSFECSKSSELYAFFLILRINPYNRMGLKDFPSVRLPTFSFYFETNLSCFLL